MTERTSLTQVVQIGVEATPGSSVAATKRLQLTGIEPSPTIETDTFRPAGQKFNAIVVPSKESVEASIEGRVSYTEIVYLLASVLTTPTITTPDAANAPNIREWTFEPSSTEDDKPVTFTVEHGSSVRADAFVYGLLTELGMTFTRESCELSGSMFGRALVDNVVMTEDADYVELAPVLATDVSVYLDTTHAALGTTKLTRLTSAEWSLGSRFGQLWVVDAAQKSFATHLETEPDSSASITVEADEQGMGLLNTLRNGDTVFLRIEALGKQVGTGPSSRYALLIDLALKISDTSGFSDEEGMYGIEWSLSSVHDAGWGKAISVKVRNELTAL